MSEPILTFRRAGPADATLVRDVTRAAYARWAPILGREPGPMTADYERAVREHDIQLVHIDGALAALIELVWADDHLYIENIAILPAHQGRGLGRRLLDVAEAKARGAGLSELRLSTNKLMEANVRLYRSVGYAIEREDPFMGGFVVRMAKRLGPASPS